ncbi:biotin transporter BioY [Fodinicola feengrottensis]|uniref:biotin transporter BioY n=1 Tax=Fodinicola feengrottensis TaxID=435914 RepID=UPI002441278A|nr:biotin transporter BioY [Fodinicola feengrottensis]
MIACVVGGVVVIYAVGIPYWAVVVGSLPTAAIQSLVFIPGDVAKAVIVSLVAVAVHRAYPTLVPVSKTHAAKVDVTSISD